MFVCLLNFFLVFISYFLISFPYTIFLIYFFSCLLLHLSIYSFKNGPAVSRPEVVGDQTRLYFWVHFVVVGLYFVMDACLLNFVVFDLVSQY